MDEFYKDKFDVSYMANRESKKKTCKVNVSSQLQRPVMFLKFFAHKEKCVLVKLSEMRM